MPNIYFVVTQLFSFLAFVALIFTYYHILKTKLLAKTIANKKSLELISRLKDLLT